MSSRLNPYLTFPGNAREALEFYRDVFGGTLRINTFGEFGAPDAAIADQVMHGQLETDDGYTLMGSDTPPDMEYRQGTTVVVCLNGDDAGKLHGYWERLADGATVTMPLEKQMWGDEYGDLVDKYGVSWMVNLGGLG